MQKAHIFPSASRPRPFLLLSALLCTVGFSSPSARAQLATPAPTPGPGSWIAAPIKTSPKSTSPGIPLSEAQTGSTVVSNPPYSSTWETVPLTDVTGNRGGGAITGTQSGTTTQWLQFVPSVPGQIPPDKVPILVHVTGIGSVSSQQESSFDGSISLHMGPFSGLPLTEFPIDPLNPTHGTSKTSTLDRKYLVQAVPALRADGNYYIHVPVPINNSVSLGGNRSRNDGSPAIGAVDAQFTVEAQKDNRSVKLTRGGRYEYSLLESGEWHTYGDSIYSARNPSNPYKWREVNLNINVDYMDGLWTANNVTSSWLWGGLNAFAPTPNTDSTGAYGYTRFGTPTVYVNPPLSSGGHDYIYQGNSTGAQPYTVSYTATDDRDQATATAYYHLDLHDPVERAFPDTFTTYTVEKPLIVNGVVQFFPWNGMPDEVNVGESTSTGFSLESTVSLEPFKEFLGLEASASYESKYTFDVSINHTLKKDDVHTSVGNGRYVIMYHPFSRRHMRYYAYDEYGKIKRLFTPPGGGAQQESYHEAFEDKPLPARPGWSDEIPWQGANTNFPTVPLPPFQYDDPSGGSS